MVYAYSLLFYHVICTLNARAPTGCVHGATQESALTRVRRRFTQKRAGRASDREITTADVIIIIKHDVAGWTEAFSLVSTTLKKEGAREAAVDSLRQYIVQAARMEAARAVHFQGAGGFRDSKRRAQAKWPSDSDYAAAVDGVDDNLRLCNPDYRDGALMAPPYDSLSNSNCYCYY